MRIATLLAFLILISAATPVAAEDYAPGTIGYLYEDCQKAVQVQNVNDFIGSYCSRFAIGYFWGYTEANFILPHTIKGDPCADELTRQFDHIEKRTCKNIAKWPDYAKKEPILTAIHLFFGWVDYLKANGQEDLLNKSVAVAFNDMIAPGPYCDIVDGFDGTLDDYVLSPALHKIRNNPLIFKKAYEAIIAAPAIQQCKDDTTNPDGFRASLCGAEVIGFTAGLNSTRWIQENPLPAERQECQPGVTRLYSSLDAAGYRCMPPDADPILLTLAYLRKPPRDDKKSLPFGRALGRVSLCAKAAP